MKTNHNHVSYRKPIWWVALLMPFVLILAACAPAATPAPTEAPTVVPPTAAPAPTATTAPTATAAAAIPVTGAASLNVATDAKLGKILVGNNGMTVYMYAKDSANTATCAGNCAKVWPPLLTQGAPALGDGVDASLVGTAALADGTTIVTYNKMPLYYFAKDKAAGDVLGQGVGNVWYVVGPDGMPIGMAAPTATAAPAAASGSEPTISIVTDPKLGKILVGDKGMTLYIYTKDTPNTVNCSGNCAKVWPPLMTMGSPTLGAGVDASLIGTATLADGSKVVTYNKMPLYYFAKDKQAGDTTGVGVGGVWFAIGPDGSKLGTAAAPAAPAAPAATATSSGGYKY